MENIEVKQSAPVTVKQLFYNETVKGKFKELLGSKSQGFITSILQITASSDLLSKADPISIYNSACVAAILDLPINQNLGFAYIVPYNQKQTDGSYKVVAQFQMGYKGFIQLSQRSGQFKTISATPIFEGQLIEENPLTGYKFDFTKKAVGRPIGYAAYFELLNGFQKTLYMSVAELESHGKKFSQSYKKNYGLWRDDFDSMAIKTVIKLLLSKFAPLSIDMQKAVILDQGVIKDDLGENVEYADHELVQPEIRSESQVLEDRLNQMIDSCKSIKELSAVQKEVEKYGMEFPNILDKLELKAQELK